MNYSEILSRDEAKKLRFLFINPSDVLLYAPGVPGGIAMLAAILEENKVFVRCLDYQVEHFSDDRLRDIILENKINCVGITGTTSYIKSGYRLIDVIKSINKDIIVLMGGSHVSDLPEEPLDKGADLVIRGEGEDTFSELLPLLESFHAEKNGLEKINGITYRLKGETIHTAPRARILDLDLLPYQARHLFPFPDSYRNAFRITSGNTAQILGSRGCPYRCIFCCRSSYADLVVSRRPEAIVDEILFLKEKYNIKQIDFADEFFFYAPENIREFCNLLLEKDIRIHWSAGNTRVDRVDREIFKLMKKSGCFRITYGIESGSEKILKKIGKKISLAQAREAVNIANDAGLLTGAFFMIGHHNETVEDIEKTISFAKSLPTSISQFTINTPFPGTTSYKILKKKGQILTDDWNDYTGYNKPVFFTDHLTQEKIMEMYKKAYRECNYNPGFILNHIKNIFKTRGKFLYLYYTGFFQMLYRLTSGKSLFKKDI